MILILHSVITRDQSLAPIASLDVLIQFYKNFFDLEKINFLHDKGYECKIINKIEHDNYITLYITKFYYDVSESDYLLLKIKFGNTMLSRISNF